MSKRASTTLADELVRVCKPVDNCRRIWVAFSGGLDSAVLLHALSCYVQTLPKTARPELCAVHVNHGLSPNAMQWQQHCQEAAAALGITCVALSVVLENDGRGVEAEARHKRYSAISNQLIAGDLLVTGHHADDQVETVLFRLLRGSGPAGLAGMQRRVNIYGCEVFRPLLSLPRQVLEEYANEYGLSWVEDESNEEQRYSRNYLRHSVVPTLASRWPGYRESVMRSADWCREADDLLQGYALQDLKAILQVSRWGEWLPLASLRELTTPKCKLVIGAWCRAVGVSLPRAIDWKQIIAAVKGEATGCCFDGGEYCFQLFASGLYLVDNAVSEAVDDFSYVVDKLPFTAELPQGVFSIESKVLLDTSSWRVTNRRGGERCRPLARQGGRSVKKLLQEAGVPPWFRQTVPLLYAGEQLIAVADLYLCEGGVEGFDMQQLECLWCLQ
ncbi:tRNA(Ile)-lysidine synthase [Sinobacterium caligoides]|uniref:tRNA(Ile)-lysidine synthase n=1 Tax=Sinobacterium caligoides TaxID=933926 RepID=A0A3N2DMK0_9GAMM|nr:tRNA lysidine(34) synthetase TilS [Sinobacterium caligoides]ROS01031.1 tRNA(Ile)-lysidine synthase [Sinobacterium caligoides]